MRGTAASSKTLGVDDQWWQRTFQQREVPTPIVILSGVLAVVAVIFATRPQHNGLVLTGIVTTDEVIVSSEIQGRLEKMSAD